MSSEIFECHREIRSLNQRIAQLRDENEALKTVCAKTHQALKLSEPYIKRMSERSDTEYDHNHLDLVRATLALTPADVADKIAEFHEQNCVLQSQVDNADATLMQQKLCTDYQRQRAEKAEAKLAEARAELREATERMTENARALEQAEAELAKLKAERQ